jgi:hypothetical protein
LKDGNKYSYLRSQIFDFDDITWQIFEVNIKTAGDYTFSLALQDERTFPRDTGFKYAPTRVILTQWKGESK